MTGFHHQTSNRLHLSGSTIRPAVRLVILTMIFLFSAHERAFAATTTAGTASATVSHRTLSVSAPYTDDDNSNNSLLVEWGLDGIDFSLGSQALPHSASPYIQVIGGLNNHTAYQIRVTWIDGDNGSPPVQTITGLIPNCPLLHSSRTAGSSKWGAGGWGIPGGKYGEFTCATCHAMSTGNIKRIRDALNAPNGTDQFPIETAGGSVSFTDTRDGSSDMGDDTGGHANSQKICEVCHSITNYHRYNTLSDPDGAGPLTVQTNLSHYNGMNCIPCHKHSNGFIHGGGANGCIACHGHDAGYEYAAGKFSEGKGSFLSHSTHTENDADDLRGPDIPCDACHDTNKFPYFKSGTDGNGDGKYSLSETDVCDPCHSPGGAFNGVTSTAGSVGAKDNWDSGAYNGGALQAGKEKWCIGCHDSVPAVISGETAPDKAGDNSSYGYYVTGHGRSANYQRLSWQDTTATGNPGAAQSCAACHESTSVHLAAGPNPAGSRLKAGYANDQSNTNCTNCHKPAGSAVAAPQWYTTSADYENSAHGGKLCSDCHDVHGAPGSAPGMTRENQENLCDNCHANGGHPGVGSTGFSYGGKSYTLECVSCHNVHLVTGTYAQADQDKSPVTRFGDPTNIWGDSAAEKMDAYAAGGTYRTPTGEAFSGAQLPDYATFCTDCHGQGGATEVPFGINWSSDPHGKSAANSPNGGGTCPDWFACGKATGWDNDDCVGTEEQCWPAIPRGKGDQLYSRDAYSHADRIGGANFVLSCTDCHTGHGTGSLGRGNVNGGAFSGTWNSMCNNCHYYYSDWHAGMSCGNASCHVSSRMSAPGVASANTPHQMANASGSGATRSFSPDLVLSYAFEGNLDDSGDWRMHGKWMDDIAGSYTGGVHGQALVLNGGKNVQVGTRNSYWSTDAGKHGTWVYTEMKYNTTLEAWVYPAEDSAGDYSIFSKHTGTADGGYVFNLRKVSGSLRASFNAQIDNNGFSQDGRAGLRGAYSSIAVPLNRWTHVAVTFDKNGPDRSGVDPSAGRIRIYVNGEDVTTSDAGGNYMQPGAGETSMYAYSENSPWNQGICPGGTWCASEFSIGGFYGWQNEFIGRLDDAKVWNITKDAAYFAARDTETGPYLSAVEGFMGSNQLTVTFSEGVYTDTGASGALVPADFILTDTNNDNARTITGVTHTAGSATAVITMSQTLTVADVNADLLAAVGSAIFDEYNNAAGTETSAIGLSSQCPSSPITLQFNEASGSTYVMDTQSALYGTVYGGASTLTGSAYSGGGDGSGRYVNFPYNSTCLQADRKMTIETRIKPTGISGTTNYIRRILARDGNGNFQLSLWRNDATSAQDPPSGVITAAMWVKPVDPNPYPATVWKGILTDFNSCPIVNDHWYLLKTVWNSDNVGGIPLKIYMDDQGTDGNGAGENWAGSVDCTDSDQSQMPADKWVKQGDSLPMAAETFTVGTNRANTANNLFNGLIDWIRWEDAAQ